ncbi:unnamed protein product [Sphenostylis stenocarpa]|uniref:Uncharacterized protein n=1 Tax=Sphenostylis stenocarpa TaxID=92480 RepID=A0AA86SW22_9FABA|nr:unnamed protein product [Sphenostylis stenocarpa]
MKVKDEEEKEMNTSQHELFGLNNDGVLISIQKLGTTKDNECYTIFPTSIFPCNE